MSVPYVRRHRPYDEQAKRRRRISYNRNKLDRVHFQLWIDRTEHEQMKGIAKANKQSLTSLYRERISWSLIDYPK